MFEAGEIVALVILGLMNILNFWFAVAKHIKDRDQVTRAEVVEMVIRLERENKRLERITEVSREEVRGDLAEIYRKLSSLSDVTAAVKPTLEHVTQQMIRMEHKLDNLRK